MARLVLIAVVAFAAVVLASQLDDHAAFKKFMADYSKKYATRAEEAKRFGIFQANLKRAAAVQKNEPWAKFGVTQFMDLTPEEIQTTYKMPKGRVMKNLPLLPTAPTWPPFHYKELPSYFFWGTQNLTSPVKNQAQCGSCWAFSATEQIETMWAKAKNLSGKVPILSPEQIVECDTIDGTAGCEGGWTQTAYAYVIAAGGIETNANYPYTSGGGVTGKCKFNKEKIYASINKWFFVTSQTARNQTQMQYFLVEEGPISICVDATSWEFYQGGILKGSCPENPDDIDHCVQLVGYGSKYQDVNVDYWIVRNSWATSWGEAGYIYIHRNTSSTSCGMADVATTVVI